MEFWLLLCLALINGLEASTVGPDVVYGENTLTITWAAAQTATARTIPENQDLGTCICDLTQNLCDDMCCCDPDCSTADVALFETCLNPGPVQDTPYCLDSSQFVSINNPQVQESPLCILKENNPLQGDFYQVDASLSVASTDFGTTFADESTGFSSHSDNPIAVPATSSYNSISFIGAILVDNTTVSQVPNGWFGAPAAGLGGFCAPGYYSVFLTNEDARTCLRESTGDDVYSACESFTQDTKNLVTQLYIATSPSSTPTNLAGYVPITLSNVTYDTSLVTANTNTSSAFFNATVSSNSTSSNSSSSTSSITLTTLPYPYYDNTTCSCNNVIESIEYTIIRTESGVISSVLASVELVSIPLTNVSTLATQSAISSTTTASTTTASTTAATTAATTATSSSLASQTAPNSTTFANSSANSSLPNTTATTNISATNATNTNTSTTNSSTTNSSTTNSSTTNSTTTAIATTNSTTTNAVTANSASTNSTTTNTATANTNSATTNSATTTSATTNSASTSISGPTSNSRRLLSSSGNNNSSANCSVPSLPFRVTQTFQVSYRKVSEQPSNIRVLAGNPGLVVGRTMLGGILVTESGSSVSGVLQLAEGLVMPKITLSGGICNSSPTSAIPVNFRENLVQGCRIQLSRSDLRTFCQSGTYPGLIPIPNLVVGMYGNSNPDAAAEWIPLTATPPPLPTWVEQGGVCSGVVTSLIYQFIYVNTGAVLNPQPKLIGARAVYDTATWIAPPDGETSYFYLHTMASFSQTDPVSQQYVAPPPPVAPKLPSDIFYPFQIGSDANTLICGYSLFLFTVFSLILLL